MGRLHEGAWINAKTSQWPFIDEHPGWAKRSGSLSGIGLPDAVREAMRDIPNGYGGENRTGILLAVSSSPWTPPLRSWHAGTCCGKSPGSSRRAGTTTSTNASRRNCTAGISSSTLSRTSAGFRALPHHLSGSQREPEHDSQNL